MFYIISIIIFFALVYSPSIWPETAVKLLLTPHSIFVSIFYNIEMEYRAGEGYALLGGNFVIGRECLGVSFIAAIFLLLTLAFLNRFNGRKRIIWLSASFAVAVFTGYLTNTVRIIASIPFTSHDKFNFIHALIGISLHLSVLILIYIIVDKKLILAGHMLAHVSKILRGGNKNEKNI